MDETKEERKQRIDGLKDALAIAAMRLADVYATDAANGITTQARSELARAMDAAYVASRILDHANDIFNLVDSAESERLGKDDSGDE